MLFFCVKGKTSRKEKNTWKNGDSVGNVQISKKFFQISPMKFKNGRNIVAESDRESE